MLTLVEFAILAYLKKTMSEDERQFGDSKDGNEEGKEADAGQANQVPKGIRRHIQRLGRKDSHARWFKSIDPPPPSNP